MLRQVAQSLVRQSRQMLPRQASRQMCTTPEDDKLFVDTEAPRASDFSRGPRGERCVNSVTLIGHLGADPELKRTLNMNLEYALINMATNYMSRNRETGVETSIPSWHRVVVFNPNSAKYCARAMSKGDKVYVHGRLNYINIKLPDSSVNIKKASIIAEEIFVLQRNKPFSWKSEESSRHGRNEEFEEDNETEWESQGRS